jgi:hypothetical protein
MKYKEISLCVLGGPSTLLRTGLARLSEMSYPCYSQSSEQEVTLWHSRVPWILIRNGYNERA